MKPIKWNWLYHCNNYTTVETFNLNKDIVKVGPASAALLGWAIHLRFWMKYFLVMQQQQHLRWMASVWQKDWCSQFIQRWSSLSDATLQNPSKVELRNWGCQRSSLKCKASNWIWGLSAKKSRNALLTAMLTISWVACLLQDKVCNSTLIFITSLIVLFYHFTV